MPRKRLIKETIKDDITTKEYDYEEISDDILEKFITLILYFISIGLSCFIIFIH